MGYDHEQTSVPDDPLSGALLPTASGAPDAPGQRTDAAAAGGRPADHGADAAQWADGCHTDTGSAGTADASGEGGVPSTAGEPLPALA